MQSVYLIEITNILSSVNPTLFEI